MPAGEVVLRLHAITKDYRGLRPLRVALLELHEAESVALLGFDQVTAEILVNLVTGAMLPDEGEVSVFGQRTSDVNDSDTWLKSLDRFGILSDRAVLLDQLTAEQNLAIPFSLELDDMPSAIRLQVRQLAEEVGLSADELTSAVATLAPAARTRIRLGRALALSPRIIVAEHPTASLDAASAEAFAADLSRILAVRRVAALVLTADRAMAGAVAQRVLTLNPATGDLKGSARWKWFS
jgi:ABC-type lipoprotein export system ATPase subunit